MRRKKKKKSDTLFTALLSQCHSCHHFDVFSKLKCKNLPLGSMRRGEAHMERYLNQYFAKSCVNVCVHGVVF